MQYGRKEGHLAEGGVGHLRGGALFEGDVFQVRAILKHFLFELADPSGEGDGGEAGAVAEGGGADDAQASGNADRG